MSIMPQENENNQECESRISKFFSSYKIDDLLRKCGAGKEKGIAIVQIFRYLMCLMFSDRSMYMQITTKRFKKDFSKNTVYRFLNNSRINWERFTTMLSERIVNGFMRPLTSENRENICQMIRSIHCSTALSHVYLSICVILCIWLTLRDIELPISSQSVGFGLIFDMGSLSNYTISVSLRSLTLRSEIE